MHVGSQQLLQALYACFVVMSLITVKIVEEEEFK